MAKKSFLERKRVLSLIILFAVILVWVSVFMLGNLSQSTHVTPTPPTTQSLEGCTIEYGFSECMDGNLVTPFYNPGTVELRRVSMYFYDGDDVDIYNCRDPLHPGEKGTLTTIPCTSDVNTNTVKLEFCCSEDCHDTMMDNPSDDLSLVRTA